MSEISTFENLKERIAAKRYADKQTECMKKLISYRHMLEKKKECMEYADRINTLVQKANYFKIQGFYLPLFFNSHKRRLDINHNGHLDFIWILGNDAWCEWNNGEIKVYSNTPNTTHSFRELKESEEAYTTLLEEFEILESEFENFINDVLKGY